MKCVYMLLLVLVCGIGESIAQVVNIPETTKKSFTEKYPAAAAVKWNNNVTNYTASFTVGKDSYVAHYFVDGNWNYTEKFMNKNFLPGPVKTSYLKSRIASYDYKSSAYIENSKGEKAYRIGAKNGIEIIYLFFDKYGKELKALEGI